METLISLSIGILYYGFINKSLIYVNDFKKYDTYSCVRDEACNKLYLEKSKNLFSQALIISFVTLVIAGYYYNLNNTLSFGLGFGSLLLIIYYLIWNWRHITDEHKILIFGIGLSVLGYHTIN